MNRQQTFLTNFNFLNWISSFDSMYVFGLKLDKWNKVPKQVEVIWVEHKT